MLRVGRKFARFWAVDCARPRDELEKLCLSCGLCCNGVLFADVKLHNKDNAEALRKLGLALQSTGTKTRFKQPCSALSNRVCGIYGSRPTQCRAFECLLYKAVSSGEATLGDALKKVKKAQSAVRKVSRLLDGIGDDNTRLALRTRFRRMMARAQSTTHSKAHAELIAKAGAAMHELTMILSDHFYR